MSPDPGYPVAVPSLVRRAMALATELGFPLTRTHDGTPSCSIPEVGRLLATLVAARPGGRIAETGTGTGVGAAWMAGALVAGATLVSVERDAERAAAAATLFADRDDVQVVHGDWTDVLVPRAPFDLVFCDSGLDPAAPDLVELVRVGGQLVMDDVTPAHLLTHAQRTAPDAKRELAFGDVRLLSTEVGTTATDAALVMTRIA